VSLEAVARKDFEDAVRSRWLLGLTALFVALVSAAAWVVNPGPGQTASTNALLNSLFIRDALVTTLMPLIALVIAYSAVVGERESGSLKLLLSLPHSRAEVVFGKVLGRSAALTVALLVGFLLPAVVLGAGALRFTFDPVAYLGYTLLTAVLGVVFVAIAVGFSAATASQRIAIGGAIALYFLFVPLWGAVQFPLQLWLGMGGGPAWLPVEGQTLFRFLRVFNPTGSFKILAGAYLGEGLYAGDNVRMQVASTSMLLAWLLGVPLLGLWRFERADL
jgi:ABC-2 type transport system permease protein